MSLILFAQIGFYCFILPNGAQKHEIERFASLSCATEAHLFEPFWQPLPSSRADLLISTDAFLLVKEKRPTAAPNSGFFKQLQQYDAKLFGTVSFDWPEYLQFVLIDHGFDVGAVRKAVEVSSAHYHIALELLLTGQVS